MGPRDSVIESPCVVVRSVLSRIEHHYGWLLVSGLVAVGLAHWAQWRRGGRCADQADVCHHAGLTPTAQPRVSVLLPAWNEAGHVGRCIDSILGLRYPDIEVVVCAGGDDGTLTEARQRASPKVAVLEQYPGEGKQRSLKRCFEQCSGDIIYLTDADCIVDDECFEKVIAPVSSGAEEVATGSWQPLDEQKTNPFVLYQWTHNVNLEVVGGKYVSSLIGRNAAVSRHVLQQVGAFDTPIPIGTDLFLSNQILTAGYRICFVPDSRVRTRYSESLRPYLRQRSRWFRNPVLLGMRNETVTIRGRLSNLRAGLAAVFMLTGPITAWLGGRLPGYLWLTMAWHLLLNQVHTDRLARMRGVPRLASRWQYLLFLAYMVLGWFATARGLVESLLPSRQWKW